MLFPSPMNPLGSLKRPICASTFPPKLSQVQFGIPFDCGALHPFLLHFICNSRCRCGNVSCVQTQSLISCESSPPVEHCKQFSVRGCIKNKRTCLGEPSPNPSSKPCEPRTHSMRPDMTALVVQVRKAADTSYASRPVQRASKRVGNPDRLTLSGLRVQNLMG
jgi:hypothetical protein